MTPPAGGRENSQRKYMVGHVEGQPRRKAFEDLVDLIGAPKIPGLQSFRRQSGQKVFLQSRLDSPAHMTAA